MQKILLNLKCLLSVYLEKLNYKKDENPTKEKFTLLPVTESEKKV